MVDITSQLGDAILNALRRIPEDVRADIYVVSLYVYDEEDDPRRPTVTVGYNTVEQWKATAAQAWSSEEAKWNYAFWLQNELACFGETGSPSQRWVSAWIKGLGLWYSDAEEDADPDRTGELAWQITSRFVDACCEVVRRLHSSGDLKTIFGHALPVLVHELEYDDEIAEQNEAANPPGTCAEFVDWIRAGC